MSADRPYAPEEEQVLRVRMKAELRRSMQRVRSFTPKEVRDDASRAICERVGELLAGARSVALFRTLAHRGEVETRDLDAYARARALRVAYPSIDDDRAIGEADMSFRWVDDPTSFEQRGRGFEEPPRQAPVAAPGEIDVIVVPGLAFDPEGYRLGYGAGLYDRALLVHQSARTIGVAFDFQIVLELPRGETDVPVSTIVTDKRVIEVRR